MKEHRTMDEGIAKRYQSWMPQPRNTEFVSLGEGSTPLVRLHQISEADKRGIEVYAKLEYCNPTGSFKDRGMCMAVTMAKDQGKNTVLCASTGNTSASAAAYAARAQMRAVVLIPQGRIAMGKLSQAIIHGASIVQIKGNFDDAMKLVKDIVKVFPATLVNSVNPDRIEGQKSLSFEICDALGSVPDYHCIPVGNAGNITASWKGYLDYQKAGIIDRLPTMLGYQARGANPFVVSNFIENPNTVASAIRIGKPQSWKQAWTAQKDSHGWFRDFCDEDILKTQRWLASTQGIFCEPASAVSVAGTLADIEEGKIASGSKAVCILTGHGLKDGSVIPQQEIHTLECDQDAIIELMNRLS